ncbi:EamA family transporter [Streptomyces sp. NRRL F-5135]|uniref:EamA family transporter n=1 Tax=Streptomyces sp. NRRL F-5135 TaxID=1463858 RepID=UPI00131B11E9|nr:EamA family transporter [Streptomyces sp. NRRL F-5135]
MLSAGLGRGGLTGAAILLPAAIRWVLGSHLDDHSAGVRGPAAQLLAGGAAPAVAAAVRGEFASPPRPTWGAGLALTYLVVFGSPLAMAAYRHLTARTSPALATSYAFVAPVIAVLSGALFLDEPLTTHVLAGTALIAVALCTTLLSRSRPAAGPTTTTHPRTHAPTPPMVDVSTILRLSRVTRDRCAARGEKYDDAESDRGPATGGHPAPGGRGADLRRGG